MNGILITGANGTLGRAIASSAPSDPARRIIPVGRSAGCVTGLVESDYSVESAVHIAHTFPGLTDIIHCAGRPAVFASVRDPAGDHANNFDPILFTLEVARHSGAAVTLLSSAEIYCGEADLLARVEDSELHPEEFYSLNKLFCEQYLKMYGRIHGVPYHILRLSAVFGSNVKRGVVYDLLDGFLRHLETIRIFCSPDSRFDLLHDVEAAAAVWHILKLNRPNQVWNVGSGEVVTVAELIQWLCRRFGYQPEIVVAEAFCKVKGVNAGKLFATGWRPSRTVTAWLEQMIAGSVGGTHGA